MHIFVDDPSMTATEPHDLKDLKRDDIWYEDGNIILQTDTALFRVYSGLLAARSSVFKDMLAFPPPPEGNLTLDGCPVVRLYDSTEDVRCFLNAIFDSGYFEPPPSHTQLCIVSGVLRLSTKYDVQFLRRRALQHLAVTFPSTLEAWHQRDKTRTIPPVDNTPFAALQVAREFDLPWIVPSIMYCISSHPLIKSLEGTEWAGKKLRFSCDDQRVALLGREKLLMLQNRYSVSLSQPPPESSEDKCTGEGKCASTRQKVPEIITGWTVACYLDFYREHEYLIDHGFCKNCHVAFTRRQQLLSEEMWSALPFIFGLEDWVDLDKQRERASE
ncbi:hypothetical protein P691DRAFT_806963 [Macrolepiota fuliginosa MF-IS2]|uniref:BTB domain-containing protein n=1 Tax=Macrolepiota fuliginosa MF-IS2 TaxID=1400762 RepID=A0A9P6C0K4_9AGAR|nr:hypothetical protein P691DRAFT_806963 [Macrolepiota fuliginosa MF-IS2]